MTWHPPFSSTVTTLLILAAAAVMAGSYFVSRRQLNVHSVQGLLTILLRIAAFCVLLFMLLQPTRLPDPQTMRIERSVVLLIDTSASMSERAAPDDLLRTRLQLGAGLLRDHQVIERLAEAAKLHVFSFSPQLVPIHTDVVSDLVADGQQTDLASAVLDAVEITQTEDLAAILLISDGRHNHGTGPRQALDEVDVPIHTVAVGQAIPVTDAAANVKLDLAVDSVTAEPRIILGRTAQIVASVIANGVATRQLRVELTEHDQPITTTAVAVSPQRPQRQALFIVKPDQVGKHDYEVRIPVEDGETDVANNSRSITIEVVDPVHRLLFIDRLRFERKYLKRTIDRLPNVRHTSVVQQAEDRMLVQGNDRQMQKDAALLSDTQLLGLKVVVIGDVPASTLTDQQAQSLADWVDNGGSLMLLAGPQSMGENGFVQSPLGALLPITAGPAVEYREAELKVDLTKDGAAHPAFQKIRQRWGGAATLLSYFEVGPVKPGATTLMTSIDDASPIVVSRRYGHGKIAIVLTDSTWRWQLGFVPDAVESQSPHHVFWTQLIDWMMPQLQSDASDAQQVQLIANPIRSEVNETIALTVSVRGPDGALIRDAEVEMIIVPPDGREVRRRATLSTSGESDELTAYESSFDSYAAGEHRVKAVARKGGRTIGSDELSVEVTQRHVEHINTQPDHDTLREIAAITGGKHLEPADLARLELLAELEPREVQVQPSAAKDAISAWNRWWVMVLFVVLVSCEWLLRRINQWV